MEVNIKTKFNIGDTVWTIEKGLLRIIPLRIRSISVSQCRISRYGIFDKQKNETATDSITLNVISYSDCDNILIENHNGNYFIDDDIPLYHEEDCFATKQELIEHFLSQ